METDEIESDGIQRAKKEKCIASVCLCARRERGSEGDGEIVNKYHRHSSFTKAHAMQHNEQDMVYCT